MAFCTPCVRSTDSSVLTYVKHPSKSIKSLFRRQIFKKSSVFSKSELPIQKRKSNHRFQRIKGLNYIQEINPNNPPINASNNYDMTVFHDDELDDTQIALSHRNSKKIPCWARKSQLQLAIINQMYYNDKNPEDIFGSVQLDLAYEMIDPLLPPNFV